MLSCNSRPRQVLVINVGDELLDGIRENGHLLWLGEHLARRFDDPAFNESDFAKLVAEYDELNEKVHRAETRLDLLSEEEEEHLRKKRSHLKDHIWQHLK